jgi:hypothetical protein
MQLGVFIVLAGLIQTQPAGAQVNVLSNRYDNNRSAANLSETALTTANVNASTFGKLGEYVVDGVMFAQPLYVHGLNLGSGGVHNMLYVATMHDVVYGFDADTIAAPIWTRDYRSTSVTADPNAGFQPIVPPSVVGEAFGIMSTPVIDLPNNHMFLVTQTLQGGNENFTIHMLDIRTGAELLSQFIYNSGGWLSQRPSLALVGGQVYVGFASKAPGDQTPSNHGYLLTYSASNLSLTGFFQTTGTAEGGGIWQSGGAPAIDAAGHVYYLTGNGFNGGYDGISNFQESLLQFSWTNTGLTLSNWFTPSNWQYLDSYDLDLSASSPILLAGTNLVTFGSKTADVYVLNTANLGSKTTGDSYLVQKFHVGTNPTPIGEDNVNRVNSMVYWPRSSKPQLYAWPTQDFLYSFTFNGSSFAANGTGTLAATGMPGAGMSLSANGSTSGTGILWAALVQFQGYDTVGEQGILHAYNAENVAQELWNSNTNQADALGAIAKFTPPMVANGRVYVGTSQGSVSVYGLRSPPTWTSCSNEYGLCVISGSNTVRFGSGTNYFYKSVIGPVACNDGVFGDPLVGVTKHCDYKPESWTTCSAEYSSCTLNGSNTVRFGQFSTYTSKSFVGVNTTIACSDSVFGDPLVGVVKQCQYLPQVWATCSQYSGNCPLQGTQTVRYGAYGVYNTQTFVATPTFTAVPCTAGPGKTFVDPLSSVPGVTETCEILVH